jgi:hypothetical protein
MHIAGRLLQIAIYLSVLSASSLVKQAPNFCPSEVPGRKYFRLSASVAVRETRVIEVPREAMRTLMSRIPEMSDIIITVFAARRRRQLEERDGSLRLIGEEEDRNVRTWGSGRVFPALTLSGAARCRR